MVSRRKETSLPKDRPVRFYKIVALTFLFITILLVGSIIFMSSKRATITIVSKEKPIESTTAIEVSSNPQSLGNRVLKGKVVTTTIAVSSTFTPTGQKEKPAQATGQITIHNDSSIDQPLVATTRFLSENGVLFRLKNGVEVPAGEKITAEVYADKKGKQGNIGPSEFTIPGLNPARRKVVYGTSDEPMTGGVKKVGSISKKDIQKAQKQLKQNVKKLAKQKLKQKKKPSTGLVVDILDYSASSQSSINEEVDSFDMKMRARLAAVLFNKKKVRKMANKDLMKKAVDDTEKIKPTNKKLTIKLDSYDPEDNSAILTVRSKGKASLNPESKQLNKVMFFGKSKQELRRYLLSLDHVHSVEVEFSPAWISSVPHISDHVNVVVKKIN